jgi:hypothetical protein
MENAEQDRQRHDLEILLRDIWIKEDPIPICKVWQDRSRHTARLLMANLKLQTPADCNAEVISAPTPEFIIEKLPTGLYQIEGVVLATISEKEQEYGFFRSKTRTREECVMVHIPECGYAHTFHGCYDTLGRGVFRKTVGPYEEVIPVYAPLPYDVFAHNPSRKVI